MDQCSVDVFPGGYPLAPGVWGLAALRNDTGIEYERCEDDIYDETMPCYASVKVQKMFVCDREMPLMSNFDAGLGLA